MSHQNVIDFVERRREQGHEPPDLGQGSVLGVLPVPETGAVLMIVGYLVPAGTAADAPEPPVLRERAPAAPPRRDVHGEEEELVLDRAARVARAGGEEIELTFREFELLDYLSSAPGRVYNRRQLMAAVWDRYDDEGGRTVDVHVLRLRRKLGRHAGRIVTVRNVGYKYQPPRRR
ncbi:winged helix-turn-helix transcriptional regulator [Microbispora sp. NEAU-D428]|uniref:winged helix-turn-helix domain-containing protein n=1 Tax=Microbispora sitophila TaxID=2771537 RepID=UPI00186684CE|nr:winged helix-turn-helix domain-containing protein [Microbispora sitophila]MBE3014176.1 winged helix-turn-helix transcriptional regulator [Microbispora sitophila]